MVSVGKLVKRKQEGFTLVEVIVVLVILAILAAILIPTLTGYIDRANERALIAETRACVMAAQTLAAEDYALKPATATCTAANIKTLAEVSGTVGDPTIAAGKVTALTYTETGVGSCTYDGAKYTPTLGSK